MSKEKQTFDLATLDPLTLPELQGWKEKQEAIVKENPFIEVVDNATYEDDKKIAEENAAKEKEQAQIEENSIEMTNGDVLPLSDKFLENIEVIEPSMVDVNEAFPATDEMKEVDFEEPETMSNAEKAIVNLVSINWFFDNWCGLNEEEQQKIIDNLQKVIG